MKHISIIIPQGDFMLSTIVGPYKVFNYVNEILAGMKKPALFKVQLLGLSKEATLEDGLFAMYPDMIQDAEKTDLIIIPALDGDLQKALSLNRDFIPWIIKHYKIGAEVASLCAGAFLLASTGLLKGRKCSTHWMVVDEFRRMFPDVNLVPDKIITDEYGIYSSGGAYSFLNLVIYLVEKYAGHEIAVLCSKIFEIEVERESQSPFVIFKGQKMHDDEAVKSAQGYIETNFHEKITIDQLASMLSLSRRSLERRFKKATFNTVVEYIQRVKIEVAKKSLESSRQNVNEVMYKVGYTDGKTFRIAFKRITGLSPLAYRNKYNPELLANEDKLE